MSDKLETLIESTKRHFERAERYKEIILDIVRRQSLMPNYGNPEFDNFQEYLSDVLVEVCEIEGLE